VEETLDRSRGFPQTRLRAAEPDVRRAATTAIALFAVVVGVAAIAASLDGHADPGEAADLFQGSIVGPVTPLGYLWADGIRPGQLVVALDAAEMPGGWRVVTRDGSRVITSSASVHDPGLSGTLPLSLGAALLGALGIMLLRGRRGWVPAAAGASVLLAVPALTLFDSSASMWAIGGAAALPVGWLAWRPRIPLLISLAVTLAAAGFLAWWAAARIGGDPIVLSLQPALGFVGLWGMVIVVGVSVVLPTLRGDPVRLARPRVGDIVLLALAGSFGYLAFAGHFVPLPVSIGIGLAVLAILPLWRRRVADQAERLLLADIRERAVIDASETERAHLARELHDAPLQHLAAVIRRLELIPEAGVEAEELRLVAEQLRGMATELRPPVLDDLGLAAAVEFLGDAVGIGGVDVAVDVRDEAGLEAASRPPSDVELAIFRIVQEAMGNAARHAAAARVVVHGYVTREQIELSVEDDGRGIANDAAHEALRRGRLGLASMRRRAEAIDADLSIGRLEPGTRVSVRWRA
jgi:signal transduction histidine kinase